jgi:hypothetical protein
MKLIDNPWECATYDSVGESEWEKSICFAIVILYD